MPLLWRFLGLRRLLVLVVLRSVWRYYQSRRAAYPGRR
jgi:hypothetical protein